MRVLDASGGVPVSWPLLRVCACVQARGPWREDAHCVLYVVLLFYMYAYNKCRYAWTRLCTYATYPWDRWHLATRMHASLHLAGAGQKWRRKSLP